jgi:4-amino-4-deoxy-L-arabinose transferase-like glycosyltransferase
MRAATSHRRFVITTTRGLYAIVLVGALLRLFPIWFGLPYPHARPDEETAVAHALAIQHGDPNPHFFHWPSLTFYVLAALFEVASWIRWALVTNPVLTDADALVLARALVAVAGALTIVVVFRMATRIADSTTALLAAAFLAVALLHVRESHFAMTDVLMTLLVTVSLTLLLRARDTATRAPLGARGLCEFAAAGLAGGLAASTKYSAAAVIVSMGAVQLQWLAHCGKHRRSRNGRTTLWTAGTWTPSLAFLAAFACGFIIATPYALLDFRVFATDLRFDFTHLADGHVGNLDRGWSYHLKRSLPYAVGVPIFVAAIAGVVPFVRYYWQSACIVGAFAAALYVSMGNGHTVFFRYVLPLVPLVCLSAAVAVHRAGTWAAARLGLPNGAAVALLGTVIGGPALVNSAWFDALLAKTDTRVLAARWLAPRLRSEDTLHEAGGLYEELDLSGARYHHWSFYPAANSFGDPEGRSPDWLVIHESPLWTYVTVPPELGRLAAARYTLVYRVRATKGPIDGPAARAAVYDLQDAFFMPMSGFSSVERPGTTISIYRRADLPPAEPATENQRPD